MEQLEVDYNQLMEDHEVAVGLESIGCTKSPAITSISNRWGIGHESSLVEGLLTRMTDWAKAREEHIRKKIKESASIGQRLRNEVQKSQAMLVLPDELGTNKVTTGPWTTKVCVEDEVDIKACIAFASKTDALEDMVSSYTVFLSALNGASRREDSAKELKPLGKSTSRAVRRASGLMGITSVSSGVEAWPLPGNVIVVLRGSVSGHEKLDFAVARTGNFKDTIKPLTKAEAENALKAAYELTGHLISRDVKRSKFSYTGIYDKVEEIKKMAADEEIDEKTEVMLTRRIKNAIAVEDAITTAMVRVCEGLVAYVNASLKA